MLEFLQFAYLLLLVYFYIMIAYLILSWTPLVNSQFYQTLRRIVHPYLGMFRGWLVIGQIDLTPLMGLLIYRYLLMLMANAMS